MKGSERMSDIAIIIVTFLICVTVLATITVCFYLYCEKENECQMWECEKDMHIASTRYKNKITIRKENEK